MPQTIAQKLSTLGFDMPVSSPPAGNYVPAVRSGALLFISGQISRFDEQRAVLGVLGADVSVQQGRKAAEMAAVNLLAQIAAATDGTIPAVRRVLRLSVLIAATPSFDQHPAVANGASDLFVAVFGEAGRHSRTAVGMASLPRGVAVEIDAIVELAG